MKKVIYRIYSESVKVDNYINYDPSKSFRDNELLRQHLIEKFGAKLGEKSNREKGQFFFEKSKCVKAGLKNEKAFSASPKNCKVVEIVLPRCKKNVTIGFPIRGGEAEEYIEILVEPGLWLEDDKAVGGKLVAKDGGFSKTLIKVLTMEETEEKGYRFVSISQMLRKMERV